MISLKLFRPEAYHLACAFSKLCEFIPNVNIIYIMTRKNSTRFGAQAHPCSLPERQLGAAF